MERQKPSDPMASVWKVSRNSMDAVHVSARERAAFETRFTAGPHGPAAGLIRGFSASRLNLAQ
jgi:hypothetical protein